MPLSTRPRRIGELPDRARRPGGRPRPSRRRELRLRRRARPGARRAARTTRLLVVTRGEAGSPDGAPDPAVGDQREAELRLRGARASASTRSRCSTATRMAVWRTQPFERLVDEIAAWLAERRPAAVITFGPHGVTGHPDHIVVGNATRWAVERLADAGIAPNAVYVISPIFDPSGQRYDLSPEEQAATHRIDITLGRRAQGRRAGMPRQPGGRRRGGGGAARGDRGAAIRSTRATPASGRSCPARIRSSTTAPLGCVAVADAPRARYRASLRCVLRGRRRVALGCSLAHERKLSK